MQAFTSSRERTTYSLKDFGKRVTLTGQYITKQRADTMYSSTLKYITVSLSLLAIPCFGIYDFCEDNTIAQGNTLKPDLVDASNKNEIFYSDKSLELYCCFESRQSTVKTAWFKNNNCIVAGLKYKFSENNQVLTIPKATTIDSGKYSCRGSNNNGTSNWTINVQVRDPPCKNKPTVRSLKSTVVAHTGATVVLKCTVVADKSCRLWSFSWRKGSQGRFLSNEGSSINNGIMKLTIKNVKRKHAGKYKCKVRYMIGLKESHDYVSLIVL